MNAKIYNGNVQPNHKEYKIWVNDEGVIKTWNGTEWIEQSGSGSGSGSSDDSNNFEYIEISSLSYDSYSYDPFIEMSDFCKFDFNDVVEIFPGGVVARLLQITGGAVHELRNGRTFVMINLNKKFTSNGGTVLPQGIYTIKDYILFVTEIPEERFNSLPRITEEEFYNLDNIESEE